MLLPRRPTREAPQPVPLERAACERRGRVACMQRRSQPAVQRQRALLVRASCWSVLVWRVELSGSTGVAAPPCAETKRRGRMKKNQRAQAEIAHQSTHTFIPSYHTFILYSIRSAFLSRVRASLPGAKALTDLCLEHLASFKRIQTSRTKHAHGCAVVQGAWVILVTAPDQKTQVFLTLTRERSSMVGGTSPISPKRQGYFRLDALSPMSSLSTTHIFTCRLGGPSPGL